MSKPSENRRESWVPMPWRLALLAYAATRIPLVLVAWVLQHYRNGALPPGHFLFHGGAAHSNWLIDAFQKWDSYWFLNIVREGYHFVGPVEQIHNVTAGGIETNVTPFPLYPMLMKLGGVFADPSWVGFVISQIALIISFRLLFSLARIDFDRGTSQLAVWLFAVVPWGYAYSAIYSEAVFFGLLVGAILATRHNRLLLGGLLGMFACLARLPGILIAAPIFIEGVAFWRAGKSGRLRVIVAAGLVPFGALLYFTYLWFLTGEPNAYFVGQQGWHKELVVPWSHLYLWLSVDSLDAQHVLDIGCTVFSIGVLIIGFKRVRRSYWIYALLSVLLLLSSSYLLGLPRYLSAVFPIYLILAELGSRRPAIARLVFISFSMTAPLVFWVWTSWYYAF